MTRPLFATFALATSFLATLVTSGCQEDDEPVRVVTFDSSDGASESDPETTSDTATVSPEVVPFDIGGADAGSDGGGALFCGPANCEGCCNDDGECLPGDRPAACGANGSACTPCFGGARCTGEACVGRRICTAGTESACTDDGGNWEDGECCIRGVTVCTDGDESTCPTSASPAWRWTGEECCAPHRARCVGGTREACSDADRELVWTGTHCCALRAASCQTSESASACGADHSDRAFTGDQCCQWGN